MENTLPFGVTVYGICVALAALVAVLLLCAQLRAEARRTVGRGAIGCIGHVQPLRLAVFCIPAAFVGARLLFCLVRFGFFFVELGPLSVLNTRTGGFLLYGAVLGSMLAAAAVARHDGVRVATALDDLAAPGMLAILICRLAEGTTGEGVGAWVENEALWRFPIAVQNEFGEWQYAVFMLEALIAAVLLIVLLTRRYAPGERIMTALLLYACCQVVCESLRMDSCPRVGFVRVSQVISAVAILGVTVVRALRAGGTRQAALRSVIMLACAGVVGGIEWALDKTPIDNRILYLVMAAACAAMAVNGSRFTKTNAKG